ncbi:MAG: hypothetical protein R3191_02880 [Anaerolineales bacterium]|nr:hypothetical protein [Anaerolineales bacterium]
MIVERVRNESVWKSLKILFIGAGLLFLINIYFGFDNSLTVGEIARGQLLIHLHAASVGWITLSAIGIAIWVLTGQRDVSEQYAGRIRLLVWAAVLAFAFYIPNFWLAFSAGFATLLPVFGSLSVIVLWIAAIYALMQLRHQEPMTTVQLLAVGALLVAAIGATVGALLGMERAIGRFLPLPEGERVGAHAGMMDTYLFLLAAAIIEWFTRQDAKARWTIAGLIQAVAWSVGASLVPIAFFTGAIDQLLPIFLLLLVLGILIFLVRMGWRAVAAGPMAKGGRAWAFFGSIWLVVFFIGFIVLVTSMDSPPPDWFGTVWTHSGFVGMMTNLLLAVLAARAWDARDKWPWADSAAMWTINLGMLVFFGLKIAADLRYGAIVMGLGVLLGVITMIVRLRASGSTSPPQADVSAPAGG